MPHSKRRVGIHTNESLESSESAHIWKVIRQRWLQSQFNKGTVRHTFMARKRKGTLFPFVRIVLRDQTIVTLHICSSFRAV
jgi:hypothetical protein